LLDRIDIQIEMPEVGFLELSEKAAGEPSSVIRARVEAAREAQRKRFAEDGILLNAQMNAKLIKRYCAPDAASEQLLARAYAELKLSARAYQRILKVARTIADVEGAEKIALAHYAEAIQYRSLDQSGREA
jgi:magnesium chelatase family protein